MPGSQSEVEYSLLRRVLVNIEKSELQGEETIGQRFVCDKSPPQSEMQPS